MHVAPILRLDVGATGTNAATGSRLDLRFTDDDARDPVAISAPAA